MGELQATQLGYLHWLVTGELVEVERLNVYAPPPPPPPPKSEAEIERENRSAWRGLERALFGRVVRED